jgi:hypothetical protein
MKKILFTIIGIIVFSLAIGYWTVEEGSSSALADTTTLGTAAKANGSLVLTVANVKTYSVIFGTWHAGWIPYAVGTDSISFVQPFTQIPIGIDSSHTNTTDTTWITVTHTFHADTIYCTPNNLGSAVSYTASILYRKAAGTTVTQMGTITVSSGSTWTYQTTIANPNIPNDYQVGVCFTSVTTKGNGETFSIIVDYLLP